MSPAPAFVLLPAFLSLNGAPCPRVAFYFPDQTGIESVKLPARSPNLNAHAERFVRTIKECRLERMILFGEGSLRQAIHEFVVHYHHERNQQGLGNRLIMREESCVDNAGAIQRRQPLGGMLNLYYRQAA
jgi:putative transposase